MLAPLLAAGASLIGNLFGQSNQQQINQQNYWAQVQQNASNQAAAAALQDKQIAHTADINAQNIAFQQATNQQNIDFAREQRMFSMDQANRLNLMALQDKERDRQLQEDFAQMGIQWRAADARAAGIHPIFALSGGGAAYSPSAISLSGGSFSSPQMVAPQAQGASLGSAPMGTAPRAVAGNAFSNMGQDLSRALLATQSSFQRDQAFDMATRDLSLQNLTLRNDLLAAQIGKLKSGQTGPGLGIGESAGPDFTLSEKKPEDRTSLFIDGQQLRTQPGTSDAQEFQNRYGELADWIFGPYIMWKDFNYRQSLDPPSRDMARPNLGRRFMGGQ